jgi:hypothetical protein
MEKKALRIDPARPVADWQMAGDSLQRLGNRHDKATFSPQRARI